MHNKQPQRLYQLREHYKPHAYRFKVNHTLITAEEVLRITIRRDDVVDRHAYTRDAAMIGQSDVNVYVVLVLVGGRCGGRVCCVCSLVMSRCGVGVSWRC